MSISKRIKEQIDRLDVNADMKDMMMEILRAESRSKSDYAGVYDKQIKEYLKKRENEAGEE